MYDLLVRFMIVSALLQFGISASHFANCKGRLCAQQIEMRSRDVLRINWRSISVFPEEARRFQ